MNKFDLLYEDIMNELKTQNDGDYILASDPSTPSEKLDELIAKYIEKGIKRTYADIKILEAIAENPNLSQNGFEVLSDNLSESSIINHLLKNYNIPRDIIFKLIDKKSTLNNNLDLQHAILHMFENDEEIKEQLKNKYGIELTQI